MADRVKKVNYGYVEVPDRAGQGVAVLSALKKGGVDLLAYSGFPIGGGKAQIDLVTEDMARLRAIAKKQGWTLSDAKKGFLVQGSDKVGAVHRQIKRLADAGISVTAADAVAAGKGRYGMIVWVKEKDYKAAAKALKARK
jgi:hypothetical protein